MSGTRLARPRSLLFAPGNRADLIAKLPRAQPDAVVIDLEDAVPGTPEAKAAARPVARDAARNLIAAAPHLPVFLRVNAPHSPYFADDLNVLTPELAGVIIPKLESAADVRLVVNALATHGLNLPILAGLETGAGVWNAHEILREDAVRWAYFGAEDYTTDLGGRRTPGGLEVLYARSQVALAAQIDGQLLILAADAPLIGLTSDCAPELFTPLNVPAQLDPETLTLTVQPGAAFYGDRQSGEPAIPAQPAGGAVLHSSVAVQT
ncbi:aldolase/citrate lyase family protein, partial [Deinococcus sp. 6YEL10]|uniref:aldolase/citrate lyase family protein n=1 Tax=Deinococcus sp. 6YEL10 TaxID=2745870 RepID=UPI001E47E7E0